MDIKTFEDLQAFCLNNKRSMPTIKQTSFGPDNDKIWATEIAISNNSGNLVCFSAQAPKKEVSKQIALLRVIKALSDERKPEPVNLNKIDFGLINDKLDAILGILDPRGIILQQLKNSGDVEMNPGPSDPANADVMDELYSIIRDLRNCRLKISGFDKVPFFVVSEIVDKYENCRTSYEFYVSEYLFTAEQQRVVNAVNFDLTMLRCDLHILADSTRIQLLLSGDVEMNPGPANMNYTPLPQRKKKEKLPNKEKKEFAKIKEKLNTIKQEVEKPPRVRMNRTNMSKARANVRSSIVGARKNTAKGGNYMRAVKTIALPIDSSNFRWASKYNAQPSATSNVFERPDAGFAKTGTIAVNSPFPKEECFAVLTKIPECAAILFDQNTAGSSWGYDFTLRGGSPTSTVTYTTSATLPLNPSEFTPVKLIQGTAATTYKPHSGHLYAAQHKDQPDLRFIWMNTGDEFRYKVTNNSANTQVFSFKSYYATQDCSPVAGLDTTSGNVLTGATYQYSFTAAKNGYFAFSLSCDAEENATLTEVQLAGDSFCFGHRAIPSFDTNVAKIQSSRILGASIMLSQNSSVTNMQGKIAGAQLSGERNWMDFINAYDSFTGVKSSRVLEAINGIYGFIKPSSDLDFVYKSYHSTDDLTVTDSWWPIVQTELAKLVVYPKITNPDGQDMYWTLAYAIEYLSDDQFVALGTSSINQTAADRALEVIKHLGQWHENPLHVKDIMNYIKQKVKPIAKGVVKYTPQVMKYVQEYGPLALEIASAFV